MHASARHDHGQARELAEHDLAGVAAHAGARQVLELGAGDHAAPREPLREHPEARAEHDRERAAAGAALGELVRQGLGLAQGSAGSERHRRHSKMQGVHELLLPQSLSRAEALEHCRRYLATRIRRFRLAQALLPREVREDFIALLAWQRLGREISWGVEGFERRRGLDELASELDAALDERARSPVGIALSFAIRRHDLPEELLRRPLLEWKRDETLATFATREALLAHARALAVPEGRLLLRVGGKQGPRNEALADSLAIALQLTTWLAELAGELERGRLRIPVEDLTRGGLELGAVLAGREGAAFARAVASHVQWTRTFYARGWELCRELGAWRGRELAFVLRWHAATLSALEQARFDALRGPPPSGWLRLFACAFASLCSPAAPRLA